MLCFQQFFNYNIVSYSLKFSEYNVQTKVKKSNEKSNDKIRYSYR